MIHGLPFLNELLSGPETWRGRSIAEGFVIAELYASAEKISESSELLASSFSADCYYGGRPAREKWLADITDFRGILCIGHCLDGAPICLDTRSEQTPVISWDGTGWVTLAESADALVLRLQDA